MKCKYPIFCTLCALALFAGVAAQANLALPHVEVHSQLAHEQVEIKIAGDRGEVTGTFSYTTPEGWYSDLKLYLPVYAAEGTPVDAFRPETHLGDQKLDVVFVKKEWETDRNITDFGVLPQIEGQRVHWFMVPHVPQQPSLTEGEAENKKVMLKICYTQKLSNGKFIYTPLIPKQQKDKDYGDITVSADRPLTLLDADTHRFVSNDDKLVVEPSDKRAIVVEVAKGKANLP